MRMARQAILAGKIEMPQMVSPAGVPERSHRLVADHTQTAVRRAFAIVEGMLSRGALKNHRAQAHTLRMRKMRQNQFSANVLRIAGAVRVVAGRTADAESRFVVRGGVALVFPKRGHIAVGRNYRHLCCPRAVVASVAKLLIAAHRHNGRVDPPPTAPAAGNQKIGAARGVAPMAGSTRVGRRRIRPLMRALKQDRCPARQGRPHQQETTSQQERREQPPLSSAAPCSRPCCERTSGPHRSTSLLLVVAQFAGAAIVNPQKRTARIAAGGTAAIRPGHFTSSPSHVRR